MAMSIEERKAMKARAYRKWLDKNRDYASAKHARWVKDNPLQYILSRTKTSARRRGVPFDLKLEDLGTLPTHCPVLGIELKYNTGDFDLHPKDPALASLDRRDNEAGYIAGNVVIVSLRANQLKRDATPEELRLLADFYAK